MSMHPDPQSESAGGKRFVRWLALTVLSLSALVLVGWIWDIAFLKTILPGQVSMKANTAVGFMLAALALGLLGRGAAGQGWQERLALGCALAVVVVGGATLSEYLLGLNLGIDELFFRDSADAFSTSHPGRMAPVTAINFIFVGSALWLVKRSRTVLAAQLLGAAVVANAIFSLIGYVYQVSPFYQPGNFTAMALHTSVACILLGLGVLALRMDSGLMRHVVGNTVGGVAVRKLLVATVLLPVLFGWLELQGERSRIFDDATGMALATALIIAVLVVIIGWIAWRLGRAEEALRESEARLNFALQTIHTGGWELDLVNHTAQRTLEHDRIFGYDALLPEWTYEKFLEHVLPEDRPEVDRRFQAATAAQTDWSFECRIRRVDGEVRWIWATGRHLRDSMGRVRRMAGTVQDVTERKQTEATVRRANEQSFQMLVAHVRDYAIYLLDPAGRVTSWNDGAARNKGYTAAEIIGRNYEVFFTPEDLVAGRPQQLMAAALAQGHCEAEGWRVRKDGTRFLANIVMTPLRSDTGELRGFMKVVRDVTERKQAEAELTRVLRLQRAVLDGTVFSVIATTPDGTIEVFNRGAERMLGYAAAEMVGEQTPAIIHVPEEVKARAAELSTQLDRPIEPGFETIVAQARLGHVDEREWTYARKDGSRFPVLLSVTALRDEHGGISGFLGIAQDLTASKQAEVALQASEERLHRVLSHADCLVWEAQVALTDGDWNWRMTVHPSGLYHRLAGKDDAASSAGLWYRFDIPEQAEMNLRCRTAMETGSSGYEHDFRLRRDGTITWIHESVAITRTGPGQFWLVGVAVDATESKRATAARDEMATRLAKLGAQVPGMIYQFRLRPDGSSCFPYASDGIRRIYQVTPEEVREDGSKVFAVLHPDDVAAVGESIQLSARTLQPWQHEYRVRYTDGVVRWLLGSSVPEREADGSVLWHGFISDISERKDAELAQCRVLRELEQQKFALDQHALVSVTDVQGRIIHANKRFCDTSQYRREELLGKTHRMVKSDHHPKEFFAEMYRVIGAGQVWHAEICNRAKDGSLYWVDTTIVPFMGENKEPTHFIAIRTDITERKQLSVNLALARDQALDASRLKSEFLATMSHEIRTPMNAVIGMAGLLYDTPLNAKQADMTRTILGGAENLLTIINDILDFSRIEAGKMRVEPTDFNFNQIVEETVTLLAQRAQEKQLELTCEIMPWSGDLLLGDGGRVRQVLTNLIGNAIKFTDRGEVEVTVQPVRETVKRTRLRVAVRDTGVGIPREAQYQLFQPFVQADGSTTRRFGGTGLGLAISRQLVELMGGEIGFESDEGKGSVFWFELEFNRRGSAPSEAPFALPSGKRVLVVDDNETNRRIVLAQLERLGVAGDAVPDAMTALARLRDPASGPWDLVLLDWHMPGINGVDLAMLLRCDPLLAELPLVMLSSSGLRANTQELEPEFAGHLTKPVSEAQLKYCLLRVLMPTAGHNPRKAKARKTKKLLGLRLLLVEDNTANQRVASILLEKLGGEVDWAVNGQAGLARLAAKKYDVVLMDCQMPVMDGYEATRRIRGGEVPGLNPKVPIIAMTAYARAEDRARCLDSGMDDYVSKPIRENELVAALARCGFGGTTPATAFVSEATVDEEVFDRRALETTRSLPGTTGPSLLPEMVALYLNDEAARLTRLEQLANERQADQLAQEVHSFGGNAASFGGAQVRRIALDAEEAARARNWPAVADRLKDLRGACARLRKEIDYLKILAP